MIVCVFTAALFPLTEEEKAYRRTQEAMLASGKKKSISHSWGTNWRIG